VKSNRVKVFLAVSERWHSGDSKKDLMKFIKQELIANEVPKDRWNALARNVMTDVMANEKKKMAEEAQADAGGMAELKNRLSASRRG
jgi:hypothetical protein